MPRLQDTQSQQAAPRGANRLSAFAHRTTLALLGATVVSCGHHEKIEKIADCPPPPGVTAVALPHGLAPPVRIGAASLTDDTIPLDPDADVTDAGRSWRFVLAWQTGIRWIVITKREDAGYILFVFDLKEKARIPTAIQVGSTTRETLCQEAKKALTAYPLPRK